MGLSNFLKKMWQAKTQATPVNYTTTDNGTTYTDLSSSNVSSTESSSEVENFKGQGGDFEGGGSSISWDDSSGGIDSGSDSGGDGGGDGGGD